jgi:tetratricopeptide (TPR) repeat protein
LLTILSLAPGQHHDRQGQANALSALGSLRCLTSDVAGAADALEAAPDIARDIGDRGGEAEALNEAGTLHRVRGDLSQSDACHRQAFVLARDIDSSRDETHAQALAAGRMTDAQTGLRQAQEIFHRISAAEAASISVELDALTDSGPA